MYGDFSRVSHDPAKHYSSVLYQQGRVRLDAEDNELQAILRHAVRTAIAEILGDSATGDQGFAIDYQNGSLTIGGGSYYVDGIRVVNHPADASVPYWQQPYLLIDHDAGTKLPDQEFLVYLRVWERTVGPAQDPALREVALGDLAPDTALRGQVIWQVLTGPVQHNNIQRWSPTDPSPALLMAQAKQPDPAQQSPCTISPAAEYRGPENQLYRVEVRTGGQPGTATFTWSRDNGSVAVPIVQLDAAVATVGSLGRDGKTAFEVGDTVEIADDRSVFAPPGTAPRKLFQVAAVDTLDLTVTLTPEPAFTTDATLHPILRRWDAPEALIEEGSWLTLEDGVQVNFSRSDEGDYVTGDYWLIPARVATGDVEWPRSVTGQPVPRSPKGIDYHYAQLAQVDPASGQVTELRNRIVPIAQPMSQEDTAAPQPAASQPAATAAGSGAPQPATRSTAARPVAGPIAAQPATGPAPKATASTAPLAPTQHDPGVNPTAANRPEITPPVIFPGGPPANA